MPFKSSEKEEKYQHGLNFKKDLRNEPKDPEKAKEYLTQRLYLLTVFQIIRLILNT